MKEPPDYPMKSKWERQQHS